jgi:hypothetical protein
MEMNIFKTSVLAALLFGSTYAAAINASSNDNSQLTATQAVAVSFGDYIEIIDFNVVDADATKTDTSINLIPGDEKDVDVLLDVFVEFNSSDEIDFTVSISEVLKNGSGSAVQNGNTADTDSIFLLSNYTSTDTAQNDSSQVKIIDDMVLKHNHDATSYDDPWDLQDTSHTDVAAWTIKFLLTALDDST